MEEHEDKLTLADVVTALVGLAMIGVVIWSSVHCGGQSIQQPPPPPVPHAGVQR